MIQRIQSVFLGLVFIIIAVFSFLPLAIFKVGESVFYMNIFRFEGVENLTFSNPLPNIWPIAILSVLLGVLAIVSLFRYKNRGQQLKINMFNILVNIGLLISIFVYADMVGQLTDVSDKIIYDVGAYLPIVTIILLVLANRSIRKDEKLVKSADRLR
jgi:glucan phosphoethanolaminetransferase (alkaline phosphatase superfamily)